MTQDDSIAREFMVIRRPRKPLWHPHGFLQMIAALWFSSYFFFWIVDLLAIIALVYCGILSRLAAVSIVAAYLGSIVVYRPQNNKGWHFGWFLYSGFVDLVLGYYNATAIREGPPLDPKGRYLFAMSPVRRCISFGTIPHAAASIHALAHHPSAAWDLRCLPRLLGRVSLDEFLPGHSATVGVVWRRFLHSRREGILALLWLPRRVTPCARAGYQARRERSAHPWRSMTYGPMPLRYQSSSPPGRPRPTATSHSHPYPYPIPTHPRRLCIPSQF